MDRHSKSTAMIVFVSAIIIQASSAPSHENQAALHQDTDWNNFKQLTGNEFLPPRAETIRRVIWTTNSQVIRAHNKKFDSGESSFKLKETVMTDMTFVERRMLLGAHVSEEAEESALSREAFVESNQTRSLRSQSIGIDYRTDRCIPAVENQGFCGSCWAFTANLCTNYLVCKKGGSKGNLSEQQLVDCDKNNKGCDGGFYDAAWAYARLNGQCSTSAYTYVSGKKGSFQSCKRNCKPVISVVSHKFVQNDEEQIINALHEIGPLAASLDGSLLTFQQYSSGIYDDPACGNGLADINHALNIVGYGVSNENIPYWIIRNHWSKSWGMDGYAYIKRGVNMCGIEGWVAYPTV